MAFSKCCFSLAGLLLIMAFSPAAYAQIGSIRINVAPHHSSTEFEGAARGMGAFYEGLGAGLRDSAEAQLRLAQARGIWIRNQADWLEYRSALKRQYAEVQAAKRRRLATAEHLAARAKVEAPVPLTDKELSSEGRIYWPAVFADVRYAPLRQEVEAMFWQRDFRSDESTRAAVRVSCQALSALLKSQLAELSPSDYVAAKKFLNGLVWEIHRNQLANRM